MISKKYNEQMGNYLNKLLQSDLKLTNADRIRSMTDEELAEVMHSKLAMDCLNCPVLKADCHAWESKSVECKDAMLEWLKQVISE